MAKKVIFDAVILQHAGMDAGYVEFPYNVEELYGVKGQVKITALIDGKTTYRGSLSKMGTDCHTLGITKAVRQAIGKELGDTIHVELEQDLEVREVALPDDMEAVLKKHKQLKTFFDGLSYTNRKEYMVWITSAKKEETRQKRLEQFIEKLQEGKKNPTMK